MGVLANEGTRLFISDNGSSYTEVAQVKRIKSAGGKVPEVETTVLTSAGKSYRPGRIPEAGEVTFTFQRDPNLTGHQTLVALLNTPATKFWRVTYNDGLATNAKDEFQGFLTEGDPNDAEDESNHEWDVTMRITGLVTRTAGS